MSLIEKIDAEIADAEYMGDDLYAHGLKKAKEIILSSQKETITIEDKIRSMTTEEMARFLSCFAYDAEPSYQETLDYLNQPSTDEA